MSWGLFGSATSPMGSTCGEILRLKTCAGGCTFVLECHFLAPELNIDRPIDPNPYLKMTTKVTCDHHVRINVASLHMYLCSWSFIPSLTSLKLAKIDFRRMSTVDLHLLDGYNRTEMWRWHRVDGRLPTFDGARYRSDGSVEEWSGRGVEFGFGTVAKRQRLLKIQQLNFIA